MNEFETAVRLAQGATIDRKDLGNIKLLISHLEVIKRDVSRVIKQLKEIK